MAVFVLLTPITMGQVDFRRDIQPLLAAKCLACHGRDPEARKASLRLDVREAAIAPRARGAAMTPGDPESSLLIARITESDPESRMPPSDHAPMTDTEIDLIRTWIAQGADYQPHWAWEPLQQPVAGSIDDMIDAALPDGLRPAEPAETGDWLRRIAFDLTGLPPTPQQQAGLLADDSPAARAALVDTLLAAPTFGEHWSRHWLDAFSYGETNGHEFDYPLHGAWRFRDWLVRALNAQLPWGRLAQELVAGDLIEPRINSDTGMNDAVLGTGFWCMHQAVHAPVDVLRDEDDHRSDQLDALGRGLLGVTISCARCHDHKFDPISARDYQALANMLRSSRRVLAGRDENAAVSQQIAELRATRDALEVDVQTLEAWITAAGAMGAGRPRDEDAPTVIPAPTGALLADFENGTDWSLHGHAFAHAAAGTWFPTKDGPRLTQSGSLHSGLLGTGTAGTASSPEFVIAEDNVHWRVRGNGTLRVIVDDYLMDEFNALLFEGHKHDVASDQWTTVTQNVAKYRGHRAYLEAGDRGDGMLEVDAVAMSSEPPWLEPAMDRRARSHALMDWRMAKVNDEPLRSACASMLEQSEAVPKPVAALRYRDASIVEQPVYLRGEPANLGDTAPRGVPALLGGTGVIDSGSGRLQLAQAITTPGNPQLWRTAANRIWHHLMGRGLTPHIDDLGAMGTPPSHPALLDYLATVLAEGGSVQDLVRLIVLSNTYAQSSRRSEAGELLDPLNTLWHRADVRRLTGEQLRDAMLAASGELDTTLGGPPVPIHLTPAMTGRGRPATSGPQDGNKRRSLYLEVRRNFAVPMLESFDRPTANRPCGARTVSNVPAQSLTLMNDPFVLERAVHIAKRAQAESPDNPVGHMSTLLWGRALTAAQIDQWTPEDKSIESLSDVAHAMMCAKSFAFLP